MLKLKYHILMRSPATSLPVSTSKAFFQERHCESSASVLKSGLAAGETPATSAEVPSGSQTWARKSPRKMEVYSWENQR